MLTLLRIGQGGTKSEITINPGKIIAVGKNYLDHIAEHSNLDLQGFTPDIPKEPILFAKTLNTLIGPGETILLPRIMERYDFPSERVDHEAELAIIVADRCKNVKAEDAMKHILGFTCYNDVSQREIQRTDASGWFRGKSFDTFGPIGPVVVSVDAIGDPQNLAISCRVNGKTTQSSSTREMIFSIVDIFTFVSANFTLEAGDVIATGTPSGVSPLKAGDVVEIEIENIGVLSNPVANE